MNKKGEKSISKIYFTTQVQWGLFSGDGIFKGVIGGFQGVENAHKRHLSFF